jgi:hypothetical protein
MTSTKTSLVSYLVLVLILLGMLVYGVWDIRYKNQKTAALLEQAKVLGSADVFAQSTHALRNNYKDDLEFLDHLALDDDSLVSFIELIEKSGKEMGVNASIVSVAVDKEKTTASSTQKLPSRVRITIKSDGEWASSVEFLHALENLPTQVSVESSSLMTTLPAGDVSLEKKAVKEPWRLNVVLSIYSFK